MSGTEFTYLVSSSGLTRTHTDAPSALHSALALQEGSPASAVAVSSDPERGRQLTMLAHPGQILLCAAIARSLTGPVLPLGVHRLRDLQTADEVWQYGRTRYPPLKSLDRLPNNLPSQPTPFIGRSENLAQVRQLLGTARLLTLTGAAGCGKSRLALQAAAAALEQFADGAWLVPLADLAGPEQLTGAVAAGLGLPPRADLAEWLVDRQLLLILDNCDRMPETCALLADRLLRACPRLTLLATSRVRLATPWEVVRHLPPLPLPEAVALFEARSAQVRPDFRSDQAAEICRLADSLPLVIELAAASMRVLTAEQAAARLQGGFDWLAGESPSQEPRHRTMGEALQWGCGTMAPDEQILFRRAAVFEGEFDLEAAEAVCGFGLPTLTRLVDRSLVEANPPRFRLLRPLRHWAAAQLQSAGEEERLRDRHRDYWLRLASQAGSALAGHHQGLWLARLEEELPDLRRALQRSLESEGEMGLAAASSLWPFWRASGRLTEGRQWLRSLLDHTPPDSALRARGLLAAGILAHAQADGTAAGHLLTDALALCDRAGDRKGAALAARLLGRHADRREMRSEGHGYRTRRLAADRDVRADRNGVHRQTDAGAERPEALQEYLALSGPNGRQELQFSRPPAARAARGKRALQTAWAEVVSFGPHHGAPLVDPDPRLALDGLTVREQEVVRLVVRGMSNNEIARLLHISPRTVHSHLANIFSKLNLDSRLALAVRAVRAGVPFDA
jgi:predicted ATPase/DNA-binding CsgD family transcriptional regulator